MKIINASHEIIAMPYADQILKLIEQAGRTCYKSERNITDTSAGKFVQRLIASGHHSVLEHATISVRFICDRGVSHELVRHRLASYSMESTRFVNYSKRECEITFIKPVFFDYTSEEYNIWYFTMHDLETRYFTLLDYGATPEQARSILPNSTKTELVMTANLREWRHVLDLRCSPKAHPQMMEIMLPLLRELKERIPVLFDDLYEKHIETGA
jgi:thymidylate synthase (FAD)